MYVSQREREKERARRWENVSVNDLSMVEQYI